MFEAALQDAQWLEALPQNLEGNFDSFFWSQPDAAQAWFNAEEAELTGTYVAQSGKNTGNIRQQLTSSKRGVLQLISVAICVLFLQSF